MPTDPWGQGRAAMPDLQGGPDGVPGLQVGSQIGAQGDQGIQDDPNWTPPVPGQPWRGAEQHYQQPPQGAWLPERSAANHPTWDPADPSVASGETSATSSLRTAGRGVRLLAMVIDGLIVAVPSVLLVYLPVAMHFAELVNGQAVASERDAELASAVTQLGVFLVGALGMAYHAYFDGVKGATPGKRLLGLRVVHQATGERIGLGRGFVRILVLQYTSWLCFAGLFSIFFDGTRRDRGWHDMAASSRVVKH